jgi:hypothetical protein
LADELVSLFAAAQLGDPGGQVCVTASGVLFPALGLLAVLPFGTVATISVLPPALVLLPSRYPMVKNTPHIIARAKKMPRSLPVLNVISVSRT